MRSRANTLETPTAAPVDLFVDTRDARIVEDDEEERVSSGTTHDESYTVSSSRDGRDIYLPYHVENVSHIAIDVGGSLAKVVYFTRVPPSFTPAAAAAAAAEPSDDPSAASLFDLNTSLPPPASTSSVLSSPTGSRNASPPPSRGPESLSGSGFLATPHSGVWPDGQVHFDDREDNFPERPRAGNDHRSASMDLSLLRRRSLPAPLPGGRLNFIKFETDRIDDCTTFLNDLIERSAQAHHIPPDQMRNGVRLMATGGGAHRFERMFQERLGVEVYKADEMACLITGLNFITLIPDEVYWYSDELVSALHAPHPCPRPPEEHSTASGAAADAGGQPPPPSEEPLPRPSANPPLYKPVFDSHPSPKLPCLLVNIGSGVSIIKVDDHGKFERVSGTSLGGGTLWGLLSLLTDAEDFDEMLALSEKGDNANVDMLVGDIYGNVGYNAFGLKSTTIASSFGKVFRKETDPPPLPSSSSSSSEALPPPLAERRRRRFAQEDICLSLLYAISNNIGQIAYMNAEKYKLDRIYFGGYFIRAHMSTISTLSYAIRFWSKGTKRALFLRHEGYLGAVGAWIAKSSETNSPAPGATPAPIAIPVPEPARMQAEREDLVHAAENLSL